MAALGLGRQLWGAPSPEGDTYESESLASFLLQSFSIIRTNNLPQPDTGTKLSSLMASPVLSSQQQNREVAIIFVTHDGPEVKSQRRPGLHLEHIFSTSCSTWHPNIGKITTAGLATVAQKRQQNPRAFPSLYKRCPRIHCQKALKQRREARTRAPEMRWSLFSHVPCNTNAGMLL